MIVLGRTLFGSAALGIFILLTGSSVKTGSIKNCLLFFIQGAILALHWVTFFHSIQISTVAVGLLTFSTFPVFVTFMEPVFFNEKLHLREVIMAIIVFLGLALVIPSFDLGNNITKGAFWGIISGFTFAVLALINRQKVKTFSPVTVAFYQNGFAMLCLLPFSVIYCSPPSGTQLILLVILGVLCTACAHTLFIKSLLSIKAQTASIISALEPVYGIIFAIILLDEIPSARMILGGTIILIATTASSLISQPGQIESKRGI